MTNTIDHDGGTDARIQHEGQRAIALLRMTLISEVAEGFLSGMRSAGIVPTPAVRTNCHGMAQSAVDTVLARVRCVQAAEKVEPGDTMPGETTQDTIDRLVKPALAASTGDALLSSGLMGVHLLAPMIGSDAQQVIFTGTALVLDGRHNAADASGVMRTLALGGAGAEIRGVRS